MKSWHLMLFLLALVVAVVSGWLVDQRAEEDSQLTLEIPENIDYYLAELSWKTFQANGNPLYHLKSPYLEHFVREDESLIHQPDLYYFNTTADWSIAAQQGRLKHNDKVFEFERDVSLARHDTRDPLQLRAASMLFNPGNETAHFAQALDVTSPSFRLSAESARLDFKHGRHVFNQVKAVYDDNHAHQPG